MEVISNVDAVEHHMMHDAASGDGHLQAVLPDVLRNFSIWSAQGGGKIVAILATKVR